MNIQVRDNYETWVSKHVVPLFEQSGIRMTEHARHLLAYTMQSQVDEKLIENDASLVNNCERFCNFAVKMYSKKYGTSEMNYNRALNLILALTCV